MATPTDIYRNTTFGLNLQKSLTQLVTENRITEMEKQEILENFDKEMEKGPDAQGLVNKIKLTAQNVSGFKKENDDWQMVLTDVKFLDDKGLQIHGDVVKIVAVKKPKKPTKRSRKASK